jgi:hypothetical protein
MGPLLVMVVASVIPPYRTGDVRALMNGIAFHRNRAGDST